MLEWRNSIKIAKFIMLGEIFLAILLYNYD